MRKTVVVSGGFDPVHQGHIRLFKAAKELGDRLVVILNNDNWLLIKKGYVFMTQDVRAEILNAIRYVDEVYITEHVAGDKDVSVCNAIRVIKPDIFANGGDRFKNNIPEVAVCEDLNVEMVFNVGGEKVASSSDLLQWSKEVVR